MKGKRILALTLLFSLLLCLGSPAVFAEARTVHISSARELAELAQSCSLDSFSQGLTVILDKDIDLSELDFFPIPSFSGTFEGGGHKISGFVPITDGSHQGLFRYIQTGGTVRNLSVEGRIDPENGRCQLGGIAGTNYGRIESCAFEGSISGLNYIGGIAGENRGEIVSCRAEGTVDGKRFTGGIAGSNQGLIKNCENLAQVNTSITPGQLELDELNLSGLASLNLTGAEDTDVVSDSGGIVGYSQGTVLSCVNRAAVGYQHYGYNVGGIAGRQSGLISACENHGAVLGKKDTGGIVGQMEPYMLLKDSVSLADELETLNYLVSDAMWNLTNMSREMNRLMEKILEETGDKIGSAQDPEAGSLSAGQSRGGYILLAAADENEPSLEPGPADPDPSEPVPDAPGNDDPGTDDPGTDDPGTDDPGTDDPGSDEPGTDKPGNWPNLPDLDLSGDFDRLLESLGELLGIISSSNGELARDMVRVSDQLSRVIMLLANAMTEGAERRLFEDISGELSEGDTDGRVTGCTNHGSVEADSNVGGIAGAMGIEYEFDLEGVLAETLGTGSILTSTYQTKCVSDGNVNRGQVTGKRNNVGGVAGLQELGLICYSQSYGGARSSDGSYAGGIVGCSNASVRSCYAMCDVSGKEYVGGIAGFGKEIKGCGSLVGISGATACAGAIAGWADMSGQAVAENVFVHERLGAVDGISYSGRAEPVAYEDFIRQQDVPEQFSALSLRFVAEGELVKQIDFTYGGSIDKASIPAVPGKAGCSGAWPDYDYSHLTFSDTLEAIYTSRQAALASAETRDGGPMSIVLLEGDFTDGAQLTLRAYSGQGPEVEGGTELEKWAVTLSDREYRGGEYAVRYLPPPVGRGSQVAVYVYADGQWQLTDTGRSGSYLSFPADRETVVFCAVEITRSADHSVWFAAGAGLLVLLGLAVIISQNRKKKRRKAKAKAK